MTIAPGGQSPRPQVAVRGKPGPDRACRSRKFMRKGAICPWQRTLTTDPKFDAGNVTRGPARLDVRTGTL